MIRQGFLTIDVSGELKLQYSARCSVEFINDTVYINYTDEAKEAEDSRAVILALGKDINTVFIKENGRDVVCPLIRGSSEYDSVDIEISDFTLVVLSRGMTFSTQKGRGGEPSGVTAQFRCYIAEIGEKSEHILKLTCKILDE